MRSTARGGRRGAHRVQARPRRSRPSRLRTSTAPLLLLFVAAVAGVAVVASPLRSWAGFDAAAAVVGAAIRTATGPGLAALSAAQPATSSDDATAAGAIAQSPGTDAGARQLDPSGRMDLDQRPPLGGPPPTFPSLAGDRRAGLAYGSVDPSDSAGTSEDPDIAGSMDISIPSLVAGLHPPDSVAVPSAEPEDLTGYVWPLRGARITTWFTDTDDGFVVMRGKRIHDGLDIATFCGQRVIAAHSGTVLYAGRAFGPYIGFDGSLDAFYKHLRAGGDWKSLPLVVVIDDGNGYRSVYVHLSGYSVRPGDVVKAGDTVGKEGATGHATGCHLHYTLIRMDGPLVPVARELVRKWQYPTFVRERIDPIRVLSFKLRGAARRVPGVNPPKIPYRYVAPTRHAPPIDGDGHPQPLGQSPV